MHIHDVQPGPGGLIVLRSPRGEQLPLEPGLPFLAEVLEVEGGRALLAIGGRLLRCEASLPLKAGSTVWLTVKEASPRRLVLSLADPGGSPASAAPTGARLAGQPAETFGLEAGSVANPATDSAGGPSGGADAPAGQPAVPVAPAADSGLTPAAAPPAGGPPLAQAVSFLLANGRPATPEAVESVAALLSGQPDLAGTLARLSQGLTQAVQSGSLPAEALPPGFAERLAQVLEAVHFTPGLPGDAAACERLAGALKQAVQALGLNYETRLAAFLETLPEIPAPPAAPGREAAPPAWQLPPALADQDLKGLLLLLRRVLAGLQSQDTTAESPGTAAAPNPVPSPGPTSDGAPAPASAALDPVQSPGPTSDGAPAPASSQAERPPLKLTAPRPASVEAPATAPPDSSPGAPAPPESGTQSLARAVDDTLRNLTGQRLLTASRTAGGQERLELCLQLPVMVGRERHTAELRLYREAGERKRPRGERPGALRVSCRLATAHLGPVRVDLAVRPKGPTEARLFLSSAPVAALFQAHEGELRGILTTAGLRLGRVSYSVVGPLPPGAGKPGPPAGAGEKAAGRSGTIDLWL